MVHGIFAPSDEQEMQAIVREVDELRRARGLPQVGPWWQIERHGLFRGRRLRRTSADESVPHSVHLPLQREE